MTIRYENNAKKRELYRKAWERQRDEEEEEFDKFHPLVYSDTMEKEMIIDTTCSFLKPETIKTVEREYKAKYVLETDLLGRDQYSGATFWGNRPAAIFYTEEAHPQGSNYFALYFRGDSLMITDGLPSIKDVVFKGIEAEGEVVYSRYRHDFREGKNGAFVDGGRDYFKYGGDRFSDYNIVKFKVVKDHLEIVE